MDFDPVADASKVDLPSTDPILTSQTGTDVIVSSVSFAGHYLDLPRVNTLPAGGTFNDIPLTSKVTIRANDPDRVTSARPR